jgi:hypothetical protein
MPYQTIKNKDGTYKVINSDTRQVQAKSTTLEKARSQIRLLEMIDKRKKRNKYFKYILLKKSYI